MIFENFLLGRRFHIFFQIFHRSIVVFVDARCTLVSKPGRFWHVPSVVIIPPVALLSSRYFVYKNTILGPGETRFYSTSSESTKTAEGSSAYLALAVVNEIFLVGELKNKNQKFPKRKNIFVFGPNQLEHHKAAKNDMWVPYYLLSSDTWWR